MSTDNFLKALKLENAGQIKTEWAKLSATEKKYIKYDPVEVVKMLRLLKHEAVAPMKEMGAEFKDDARYAKTALQGMNSSTGGDWLTALTGQGLWADFVASMPAKAAVTDAQAKAAGF